MKITKVKVEKKVSNTKNKIKDKIDEVKNKIKQNDTIDAKFKRRNKHIILSIVLVVLIFILIISTVFAFYIIFSAPEFDTELLYAKEPSIFLDINGDEFGRTGAENRDLVTYEDLPQVLVDAIVATEDSRFFQHDGFDIARFAKASLGQIAGSNAGGASTLTMQVVKNTYTSTVSSGVKGIIRKFTDIYMSIFKVEKTYTKEEIVEFYVNAPWLGDNIWGVEQACQKYFGKSVRDISLPEAALIAGIFNAPSSMNPFASIDAATNRREIVLNLMYKHGYINEDQLNDAKAISIESLIIENTGSSLNKYQSFIDAVVNEVEEDTGMNPYKTPMVINTTMDPKVEDVLIDMNNGKLYKFKDELVQVAVAITDTNNGGVTGLIGGRNQTVERGYNRATSMFRHPGSTAKPLFDYGPLIEYNNASTGTYFWDEQMTYSNGQSLKNADGSYLGMITMRTALSKSRNIPAVQAFQQLEKDKISSFVHSLGIDYGEELYESASIGSFEGMSPLQLSAAYAAFARGGYYIEPYTYTKIVFTNTKEEYEQKIKKEKVMSEATAYMINSILMTAASEGAGGSFSISGTDIGAKTGTSTYDNNALKALNIPEASADNWNVTYSPDYTISLWYGYDKLMAYPYYNRSNAAAGARKKLMAAIAKKIYKKDSRFNVPSTVVKVEVEKETVPLQLPSDATPSDMIMSEYFKVGTEPTEVSNRYQTLDNPTNGKATTNNNTITISWDAIATPAAIDQTSLQTYFTENYKTFAEKYYNKRLSYNNTSIGYLGYQVYLQTASGLTPLNYTTDTSYTYSGVSGTDYTFVVKSSYSIFKNNQSSGLTIKGATSGSANAEINIRLNGPAEICKQKSTMSNVYYDDQYAEEPVRVTDINNNDITSKVVIKEPTITNLDTNETVTNISTSSLGKYKITYNISYNNKIYTATRTITISDTCN